MLLSCSLVALLLHSGSAIYEDQVGQLDWRLDHVGVPVKSAYASKRVFVATDQGVLASLHARSGAIEWRHLLATKAERGPGSSTDVIEALLTIPAPPSFAPPPSSPSGPSTPPSSSTSMSVGGVEKCVVTVSRLPTAVSAEGKRPLLFSVRLWRGGDGALMWEEATLEGSSSSSSGDTTRTVIVSNAIANPGDGVSGRGQSFVIAVLAGNSLSMFAASSGVAEWQLSEFEVIDHLFSSSPGFVAAPSSSGSLVLSDMISTSHGLNGGDQTLLVVGTWSALSGSRSRPTALAVLAFDLSKNKQGDSTSSADTPTASLVVDLPSGSKEAAATDDGLASSSAFVVRAASPTSSSEEGAALFVGLVAGNEMLLFDLKDLKAANKASGGSGGGGEKWHRVSLLPLLKALNNEAVDDAAVAVVSPLEGSEGAVWVLSSQQGKSVAFSFAVSDGGGTKDAVSVVPVTAMSSGGPSSFSVPSSSSSSSSSSPTSTSKASSSSSFGLGGLSRVLVASTATSGGDKNGASMQLVEVTAEAVLTAAAAAAAAGDGAASLGSTVVEEGTSAITMAGSSGDNGSLHLGSIVASFSHCVERRDGGVAFRALVTTSGDGVALLQPNKPSLWVRDEALASVQNTVFVSSASSDLKVKDHLQQQRTSGADLLLSWSERLTQQKQDLLKLFQDMALNFGVSSKNQLGGGAAGVAAAMVKAGEELGRDGLTPARRRKFGLDKVAICLTRSGRLFSLSLASGRVKWSTSAPPTTTPDSSQHSSSSFKLLVTRPLPSPEVAVLQEQHADGGTTTTVGISLVDATNGQRVKTAAATEEEEALPLGRLHSVVPLTSSAAGGGGGVAEDEKGRSVLLATGWKHSVKRDDNEVVACLLVDSKKGRKALAAAASPSSPPFYFHVVDPWSNKLESRILASPLPSASSSSSSSPPRCSTSAVVGSALLVEPPPPPPPSSATATAVTAGASSSSSSSVVVGVAYPSPADVVNTRAQILGDDSLLLKYANKHLMAAMTFSSSSQTSSSDSGSASSGGTVQVSLVDTVAGRVLHRVSHAFAAPLSSSRYSSGSGSSSQSAITLSENWVCYAYWNTKAKRTEVGVLSLYEGMVGPYDLNPLKVPMQSPHFSSFSAKPPVVMQRTFVFPKAVHAVSSTVTAQGISTKNLLFVLESGQVAMVPRRLLDPRRPNTSPNKNEQQEGLMQYHPFLFLDPRQYVTMNETVLGVSSVFATPAVIESTTLVLTSGVDLFFTRVTPSKTFDLLAADFNHPFLLVLLGGLAVMTVALKKLDREKKINAAWQ